MASAGCQRISRWRQRRTDLTTITQRNVCAVNRQTKKAGASAPKRSASHVKASGRALKQASYRPSAAALRQIREQQKACGLSSSELQVCSGVFQRLVKEAAQEHNLQFEGPAVKVLHKAAESFLLGLLEDTKLATMLEKRFAVKPKYL